jgi:magnesium-transporting ATPase (P-type)
VVYQASSPDEKALVEAAGQFGFFFKKREYEDMELDVFGTPFKFHVLNTLEFSSDRKRMSVIVKGNFGDRERIFLLSKGTHIKFYT